MIEPPDIEVRALSTQEEYAACVQLQYETWGASYTDAVPPTILQVAQKVGGVVAGAFSRDGRLLGFVFGLTGVREGRLVHWSDMLAVRAPYRNQGIGRILKEHQREVVRGLGVELMYWTFDPLVARNAHLNLNRLGATVTEYVIDMYGSGTGSDLHAFGTDRFIVSWSLTGEPRRPREITAVMRTAPLAEAAADAPVQRVAVPPDVSRLEVAEAARWRERTRQSFTSALDRGYEVIGFYTEPGGSSYYVLERS